MSDIFDEVNAELRRDKSTMLWKQYGRYLIGGAVGVVVLVAAVTGYNGWTTSRQEAASERYNALVQAMGEASNGEARQTLTDDFLAQNNGGYNALASFVSAFDLAKNGDHEGAIAQFDALASRGEVPLSLRDFARLQAAIVLLDSAASFEDIEARLGRLMVAGNDLQPMAREVLALANMAQDQPLAARSLLLQQLEDPMSNNLSRDRARILLSIVNAELGPIETPSAASE